MDLEELNLDNIGTWPTPVKAVMVVILCAAILGGGYWFFTKKQLASLTKLEKKERKLRKEYKTKYMQAANLKAYKEQLRQIKKSFGTLLRQLPGKTEVHGLLEDITKTGIASGLEFVSFKPLPEKQLEFYAEMPIEISVVGSYHQLATFVSKVTALPRIVTLHNFKIDEVGDKGKKLVGRDILVMHITAKTYRYNDENEEA